MANETNTGWVRLYRSTLGWEWFDDPLTLQLWVVCLLKANYLPTRWRGVEIERGAFVTSVDSLCAETGQTTRQIRTRLARLQASGEISVRATNYKSIITVCKFDTYQPLENENDKRPTNSYEGLRRVAGKKVAKIDKPNDKPKTHIINSNTDDYSDDTKQNDKQNDNQSTNERQTQLFSSDNSIRIYGLRRFMRPSPTRNSTVTWSGSRNASIRCTAIPTWKKSGSAFEDRFTYTQKFTQLTHSLKTPENTRKGDYNL